MNDPIKPKEKLQASYWQAHFEKQKASGLGICTYCRKEGLNKSRFYYWHTKIYGRSAKSKTKLIELKPIKNKNTSVEIILPNGVILKMQSPPSMSWLLGKQ